MKSWMSSPLAINYLLSLCKNGPSCHTKYLQILNSLKIKDGFINRNILFVSPLCNAEQQYDTTDISVEKIDFGKNNASQYIKKWINQYGSFSQMNIEKHASANTTSLLCNVTVFKDVWKGNQQSPVMKVHNSFNYTEDIQYEARVRSSKKYWNFIVFNVNKKELPMQDEDFKLVLIVPHSAVLTVSSVDALFTRLVEEGLAAAVGCVQPLFSFCTVLEAPSIEFSSERHDRFTESTRKNCENFNGTQIGDVQINENGTNISVLTLLSPTVKNSADSADVGHLKTQSPFYFAVLYKDIAVFTGRYVKRK